MNIAVISDIHSNIYALEAVLADIRSKKVDLLLSAGDLVGYAPFPNEVIERFKEKNILTVMGNYDDGIGNFRIVCGCDYKDETARLLGQKSIGWTKENTSEENKAYLRSLPAEIRMKFAKHSMLVVHGSPRQLNEYLYEDSPVLEEVTKEIDADILICGHIHKPYYKVVNGIHVINAGSVGKPKHGNPNAIYALLKITEETPVVEFIEVTYPVGKIVQAIRESELPDEFAEMLATGQG